MNRQAHAAGVELDDIQGLVRFGYKHHTEACFLLLCIKSREAARAWLAAASVASAVALDPPPPTVLQIALTSEGLRVLGVADDIIAGFSPEFVEGMSGNPNRERRLGDVGANEPMRWRWGAEPRLPHVLVALYATPGRLDDWQHAIEAQCKTGFERIACLRSSDLHDFEPFGFRDGISQPQPDWERQRAARDEERQSYTNLSCLGEFLLGYPNEYGGYTERPLLDLQRGAAPLLPRAEEAPDRADLGRNGSYLVMRQLRQDVSGFWRFLDGQAGGNPVVREKLAEAMVGRTLSGEPLTLSPGQVVAGNGTAPAADLNAFTYEADPQGLRCPLGAHIRRTNPRNADLPPGAPGLVSWLMRTLGFDGEALRQDLVASTRFHRLLRRGREYGAAVPLSQALTGAQGGDETGLHFICLNANIGRQFEFVQGAWVMGTKFNGLSGESDPLLGHRLPYADGSPTDGYSIQQADGPDKRLAGLPQFVTVVGGAYFFLPGIRALRYLVTAA